jgi:FtsZ-binding cell division protein ZapB
MIESGSGARRGNTKALVSPSAETIRELQAPPRTVLESDVRLLAERVATLSQRMEDLGRENAALRSEVNAVARENSALRVDMQSLLARKTPPSAPYTSRTPTSETIHVPITRRPPKK